MTSGRRATSRSRTTTATPQRGWGRWSTASSHTTARYIRCDDSSNARLAAGCSCSAGHAGTHLSPCRSVLRGRAVLAVGAEPEVDRSRHEWRHRRRESSHRRPRAPATYRSFLRRRPPARFYGVRAEVVATISIRSTCPRSSRSTSTFQRWRAAPPPHVAAWWSTAVPNQCWGSPSTGSATEPTAHSGVASTCSRISAGSSAPGIFVPCRCQAVSPQSASRGAWPQCGRSSPARMRTNSTTSTPRPWTPSSTSRRGQVPMTSSIGRLFDAVTPRSSAAGPASRTRRRPRSSSRPWPVPSIGPTRGYPMPSP